MRDVALLFADANFRGPFPGHLRFRDFACSNLQGLQTHLDVTDPPRLTRLDEPCSKKYPRLTFLVTYEHRSAAPVREVSSSPEPLPVVRLSPVRQNRLANAR